MNEQTYICIPVHDCKYRLMSYLFSNVLIRSDTRRITVCRFFPARSERKTASRMGMLSTFFTWFRICLAPPLKSIPSKHLRFGKGNVKLFSSHVNGKNTPLLFFLTKNGNAFNIWSLYCSSNQQRPIVVSCVPNVSVFARARTINKHQL